MKWRTTLAVFILWYAGSLGEAGEIQQSTVKYADGVYTVEFDGLLSAAPGEVYRLMTDHDHLYLLNDIVLDSRLLTGPDAPLQKRRVVLHVCILFFCRDMKLVESLHKTGEREFVAMVIPAESDFSSGRTVWQVMPAGAARSHFRLHSTFRPAFWVPPVIGPWLIRKKMEHELSVMMIRLEHYATPAREH